MTYINDNTKLELCHSPFNDMQSYDIENENENENVTFIDEQIFNHCYTLKNH
jgi:hypothetical protein